VSVLEWDATPAGTFRRAAGAVPRQHWAPAPAGVGLVAPLTAEEAAAGRVAHEEFTRAWAPVLAEQTRLAAEGWPGAFVNIEHSTPAPLRAMQMSIIAAESVVEVTAPGEVSSAQRRAAERFDHVQMMGFEAARARELAEANARMLEAEGRGPSQVSSVAGPS
jgi:hypothetical protein